MDQTQLDETLAPTDLPGKDILALYERVLDVASLPRNSIGCSDQDYVLEEDSMRETMEITALAITQAASAGKSKRALLFSSPRNHVLLRVNSKATLVEMPSKVRSAAEDDLKTHSVFYVCTRLPHYGYCAICRLRGVTPFDPTDP